MSGEELNLEKKEALDQLLEEEFVMVHLDPGIKGVLIPPHLVHKPSVTLKLSRFFRGEMELEEEKVTAQLLFDQRYFDCTIPYRAIWGLSGASGTNTIWPEATPEDVLKDLLEKEESSREDDKNESSSKGEIKKGHLRRIK